MYIMYVGTFCQTNISWLINVGTYVRIIMWWMYGIKCILIKLLNSKNKTLILKIITKYLTNYIILYMYNVTKLP